MNNKLVPGTNLTPDEAIDWLEFCCDQYYNLGRSPVSNAEYEYIYQATYTLIPEHSFFQKRLRAIKEDTKRIPFKNFFYLPRNLPVFQDSAGNVLLEEEFAKVQRWISKAKSSLEVDVSFSAMPRFDGFDVVIYYQKGYFHSAAILNKGFSGKKITEHIKRVRGVPFVLPDKVDAEIRGTVVMRNSVFHSYTTNEFNCSRDAVMGTIGLDDYEQVSSRELEFAAYDLLFNYDMFTLDEPEKFAILKAWGFESIGALHFLHSIDELKAFFIRLNTATKTIGKMRPLYEDTALNGIIVAVSGKTQQYALGHTGRYSNYKIFIPFELNTFSANVVNIKWKITRHGHLLPLALLENHTKSLIKLPLRNYDHINKHGIGLQTRVLVGKQYSIKLKFIATLYNANKNNLAPSKCYSCQHPLYINKHNITCVNPNCEAQIIEKLAHFITTILPQSVGFNKAAARAIYSANLAKSPADIYCIIKSAFFAIEGFGQYRANLIYGAIESSKKMSLETLLYALSIPTINYPQAKQLAAIIQNGFWLLSPLAMLFKGIMALITNNKKHLLCYFFSLADWLLIPSNKKLLVMLQKNGIQALAPLEPSCHTSLKICIGNNTILPQREIKFLLHQQKYQVTNKVTAHTNLYICNNLLPTDPMYSKIKQYKTMVIDEPSFLLLLENTPWDERYKERVIAHDTSVPAQIIWRQAVLMSAEQERYLVDQKQPLTPNLFFKKNNL